MSIFKKSTVKTVDEGQNLPLSPSFYSELENSESTLSMRGIEDTIKEGGRIMPKHPESLEFNRYVDLLERQSSFLFAQNEALLKQVTELEGDRSAVLAEQMSKVIIVLEKLAIEQINMKSDVTGVVKSSEKSSAALDLLLETTGAMLELMGSQFEQSKQVISAVEKQGELLVKAIDNQTKGLVDGIVQGLVCGLSDKLISVSSVNAAPITESSTPQEPVDEKTSPRKSKSELLSRISDFG